MSTPTPMTIRPRTRLANAMARPTRNKVAPIKPARLTDLFVSWAMSATLQLEHEATRGAAGDLLATLPVNSLPQKRHLTASDLIVSAQYGHFFSSDISNPLGSSLRRLTLSYAARGTRVRLDELLARIRDLPKCRACACFCATTLGASEGTLDLVPRAGTRKLAVD